MASAPKSSGQEEGYRTKIFPAAAGSTEHQLKVMSIKIGPRCDLERTAIVLGAPHDNERSL
jgi:hypothetical protein